MWLINGGLIGLAALLLSVNGIVKWKTDVLYRLEKGMSTDVETNVYYRGIAVRFGIGLVLGIEILAAIILNIHFRHFWLAFSDSRIQTLTATYGITFDEDVRPKKYYSIRGSDGKMQLDIVINKSPEAFISENSDSELLMSLTAEGIRCTPLFWEEHPPTTPEEKDAAEKGYAVKYPDDSILKGIYGIYTIERENKEYTLRVKERDEGYIVRIY